MSDLTALQELEQTKREIEPGDPRLVRVAAQIEQLASRVLGASVEQLHLTERVHRLVEAGSPQAPDASIEDMKREMRVILADWRDAERRASVAEPGSPDALSAAADIERYRAEYREAFEDARHRE
jgi:DNA-binding HxlR family transcriptional regulator